MKRRILKTLSSLLTLATALLLITAALYSGFALWDNQRIYSAAESVFTEMKEIRSRLTASAEGADSAAEAPASGLSPFEEMRAINPDVTGWVTMLGTAIDYPLLQGSSNYSYLNTDVYGNFALAGSIFLDSRNSADYSDRYSLLYGHNMSRHRMFSDVNLYKDEAFFRENHRGILYLPSGGYLLESISCFLTGASNSLLFNPGNWDSLTSEEILNAVQQDAMYINPDGLAMLKAELDAGRDIHILCLSTCSEEFTDARTLLLTLILPDA